jgi:hypothetical protein
MSYDVANRHVGTQITATELGITSTRDATSWFGSIQSGFSLAELAAASGNLCFVAEDVDRLRGCR